MDNVPEIRPSRQPPAGFESMTVRDRFAAAAISAAAEHYSVKTDAGLRKVAELAYEIADAMMAERSRQPKLDVRA